MSLRAQHIVGGTLATSTHTQQMPWRSQHIVGGTLATSTHTQQMSWRAQHIFGRSPRKLAYTFWGGEAAVLEQEPVWEEEAGLEDEAV